MFETRRSWGMIECVCTVYQFCFFTNARSHWPTNWFREERLFARNIRMCEKWDTISLCTKVYSILFSIKIFFCFVSDVRTKEKTFWIFVSFESGGKSAGIEKKMERKKSTVEIENVKQVVACTMQKHNFRECRRAQAILHSIVCLPFSVLFCLF